MSSDFELKRLNEKIKKVKENQVQTNQFILKARRDEQMELEYIRRRFNTQIRNLEDVQKKNLKDLALYERQLDNLERKIEEERINTLSEGETKSRYSSSRYIR